MDDNISFYLWRHLLPNASGKLLMKFAGVKVATAMTYRIVAHTNFVLQLS